MNGYTETIRQWATDTRRAGILENADGTGEVGLDGPDQGSRLAVRFSLKVEIDRIADIRYQVFGCGFSMAACAIAADMSVGYSLDEMDRIDARTIDNGLDGLPTDRAYCAELAAEALRAAVSSARNGRQPVLANLKADDEHGSCVKADDPVYSLLISTQKPPGTSVADRHLFACLLAVACQETDEIASALGLAETDLVTLLKEFYPGISLAELKPYGNHCDTSVAEVHEDILNLLREHLPTAHAQHNLRTSVWLCYILAARVSRPGHLWVAMGLFERPQLTASIKRHLPSLAEANNQNMRWKRYLYKQICDRNGGTMCKAPNCGVCSDYSLCFASD